MNIQYHSYQLSLAHPFQISRETQFVSHSIIIGIQKENLIGWGEACPGAYYGDSIARVETYLQTLKDEPLPDFKNLFEYCFYLRQKYPDSPAARAAVETALFDLAAQEEKIPLYQYLKIPYKEPVTTSFTIGIDKPEVIAQKIKEARDYPLLKIKLGGGNDEETMKTIRSLTNKPLRVDANCGWKKEEAVRKSEWLAGQNVEFIEQPLPGDDVEGLEWLKARSALPIILDESIQGFSDLEKFANAGHGVNIKLMKMGGIREPLDIIIKAQKMGWKIMIGCLIESAISITAAVHLSPLVDYLDLDGNILIAEDPCEGVHAYKGKITLPEIPGLGAYPKDFKEWWSG